MSQPTSFNDTICAISTAPGVGGIAVARVSGPDAIAIVDSVWRGKPLAEAATHTAHFGTIIDPATDCGELDQAVATLFRGPRSFTGEDVVEISVHGSRWIQDELIRMLVRQGCRTAAAGEFTRRAFANGRIDLAEAEAVADVIASSSRAAARLAVSQLRGDFSRRIAQLRESLIELASLLELELDFSEEEVEFASRERLLEIATETRDLISRLAKSYASGAAIRGGVPVAIVGATNAGKSSLLNKLLGDERAIVSEIHGTTRDTIEDTLDIEGVTFRLIDTAGIRSTSDPIETIGIDRSLRSAAAAQVVVWVVDSADTSAPLADIYERLASTMSPDAALIIAANKTDLAAPDRLSALLPAATTPLPLCPISASTGAGIEQLRHQLLASSGVADALTGAEIIVTNARHYEALTNALGALERVLDGLRANLSGDFIAQDLREATHHLSLITGSISTTDLLHSIFSRFCVGK